MLSEYNESCGYEEGGAPRDGSDPQRRRIPCTVNTKVKTSKANSAQNSRT
jgi:hypothetical protein